MSVPWASSGRWGICNYGAGQVFVERMEDSGFSAEICRVLHESDARLIAAAPEMYELLDRCSDGPDAPQWDEISALLARIRGEE